MKRKKSSGHSSSFKKCVAMATVICLLLIGSTQSRAATYNETINGDLSGNRLAPTPFVLELGSNTLSASSFNSPFVDDVEYVKVTVPAGAWMHRLSLTNYVSDDPRAFIGFVSGPTFPTDANSTAAATLLGYAHFGSNTYMPLDNMLVSMSTAAGAAGFTYPLAAGDYTFWVQQTSGQLTQYTFDYQVQLVPEPTALAAVALGAVLLRRRRV